MTRTRTDRFFASLLAALVVLAAPVGNAQEPDDAAPEVIASCDFEGPYSAGEQQVQDGCVNNWQWGRKDMVLAADSDSGRPGTTQRIQVRGISSGGVQFFYMNLKLKKDHYYRVSYWMKTDGLEGPVRCYVRKGGYPWTVHVYGDYEERTPEWREYSFANKCAADVDSDVGVCWEMGSLGTIWLDDLKVEQSPEPFPGETVSRPALPTEGNVLPRSSFEGRRDNLWSMISFGWNRDGVWEGVEHDWDDPQMYRAEGGKVGRYCLAVPSASHAGQACCHSRLIELIPGRPYTVSAWVKADQEGFSGSIALLYWWSGRHQQALGSVYPKLTTEWQRCSFTCTPQAPADAGDPSAPVTVVCQIAPSATVKGTVYVDGLQIEPAEQAGDYKPRYPLELYADVGQDGGNLCDWDQDVPLTLLAAAADTTDIAQLPVNVTITGYPDRAVWDRNVMLTVDEPVAVTPPLPRRGLFRVTVRPIEEGLAAPQEMLFATVPTPRDVGSDGMFGAHITVRPFHARYFRRLGFTWTRLHDCSLLTKWSATEPEPGKYQWHEEVVDAVLETGLRILGLPDHPPAWAERKEEGALNPVDVEAFGRYCEALAGHYRGKIDHWEVWNEPYMGGSYNGGAEKFSDVLREGSAGLRRGNPDCTIVGWSADVSNPKWGAEIAEDARATIDVFSFHNYVNNLAGGGTLPFVAELPDHRAQWPAHVTESWDTEGTNGEVCGNTFYTFMPIEKSGVNERATAFASRVWIEHAKAGVSKYFVYQMHNTDSVMYYGGYQSLFVGFDRTPTPAAVAAAVTAYCMDGMGVVPQEPLDGVVEGLFAGDDRATWAVYDDGGAIGRKQLDLSKLPAGVEVLDVMGNDPRRDGLTKWEIGMQPLFVLTGKLSAKELATACQATIVSTEPR